MEEGHGIYQWRESEYIFLSENRETAFPEALRIGRKQEQALLRDDRGPDIECRLAEVVYTGSGGDDVRGLPGREGGDRADRLRHVFRPEERVPPPMF